MDKEKALQNIRDTLLADGELRLTAERMIKSTIHDDFQNSVRVFLEIIIDQAIPLQTRQMASIIIKNCFHSKLKKQQLVYEDNWRSCSPEFRSQITILLYCALNTKEKNILTNIADIYASIIRIEVDRFRRPEMFDPLRAGIERQDLAVGILQTVAFACDQLYEETMYSFGEERKTIFEIGMFYLNPETNPSKEIIFAALRCVLCSVEIYENILCDAASRATFLSKIFACEKNDPEIFEEIISVLYRFIDTYRKIGNYEILPICEFCLNYFPANSEDTPLSLFEIWDLLIEIEKYDIMKEILPKLVPKLMLCVKKEDPEDNIISVHKSACNILKLITTQMKIPLIKEPTYQNFVESYLTSQEPEKHAIGATILGCICTPGTEDFLYRMVPILIHDLGYETCVNEALFAIAKICEFDISQAVVYLPTIIEKAGILIDQKSTVAVNAARVYTSILLSFKSNLLPEVESAITFHFSNILAVMVRRLDNSLPNEYDVRVSLNIAMTEMILNCPESQKKLLDHLEDYLLSKIASMIEIMKNSTENDVLLLDDVLCNYIILLEPCLSMKRVFDATNITEVFVNCLYLRKMLAHGEIYIVISKLVTHFSIHLKKFVPFLLRDLANDEAFIFKSALNLLSDCALHLESNFLEFTPTAIPAIGNAITSDNVSEKHKASAIMLLGDIALAIGKNFDPYIDVCVILLSYITSLNRDEDEEFVDGLRKCILKLFSCLIVSVGKSKKILDFLPEIISNIKKTILFDQDGVYIKESIDLVKDIHSVFGIQEEDRDWIIKFLQIAIRNGRGREIEGAKDLLNTLW